MKRSICVTCILALSAPAVALAQRVGGDGKPAESARYRLQAVKATASSEVEASPGGATASTDGKVRGREALAASAAGTVAGTVCQQPDANCQLFDITDALTSDGRTFAVAEDFRPGQSGEITSLCWRGGYFDFQSDIECATTVHTQNAFTVNYYADSGGEPGTLIASFSQLAGTLALTGPQATDQLIAGRVREREFTATHGPVGVTAGECYWIEIVNPLTVPDTTCSWLWELGTGGNGWLLQDPDLDGFQLIDGLPLDVGFCTNLPLSEATSCLPPPPENDDCAAATPITGRGDFEYNNLTATTDGLAHAACQAFGESQIEGDVWFCWTAPCTNDILLRTCDRSTLDTRLAVYEGCGSCPPGDERLLACNDDRCGDFETFTNPVQSMLSFPAVAGEQYLIRVGAFPGQTRGNGAFELSCGPPVNLACPGDNDCCEATDPPAPACSDDTCCRTVCACDPFCCEVEWTEECAGIGFFPGCGADVLCTDICDVCVRSTVDCCTGVPTGTGEPGCADSACCESVCAKDSFCCEVEWDDVCAEAAATACPGVCGACPAGTVTFVDPPDGVVDARQPHAPQGGVSLQGITEFNVIGPAGAALQCWDVCESPAADNAIADVAETAPGEYRLTLARPISAGAATAIIYRDDNGAEQRGVFVAHPGNANGDDLADAADVNSLIEFIIGTTPAPWGGYSTDIDGSGASTPADVLRLIDLLNGGDSFTPWAGTAIPVCGNCCP